MPGFRRIVPLALVLSLVIAMGVAALPAARAQDAGDTITIGMTDLPATLDAGEAYNFNTWEVLSHLYTGLTRQVPDTLDYELALAEDVQVSDDKLTYTFTLRAGETFTDGTPITAQTFVDSIHRVLALRRDAVEAVAPYVADVQAEDDLTLIFKLTRPVPFFLELVSLPPYFPQHPDLAALDTPDPFVREGLIGNGPYLLETFSVRDQIVLRANPDYAHGPLPLTDTIVLRYYARSQDLRNAVMAHEVDMAWRALLLGHYIQLETAGIDGLTFVERPSTHVFYMYMGQTREPTDDPLVREALTALIEREPAANETFFGHVDPLVSLVPNLFPEAYHPIWPDEPDLEYAEMTLGAAGYRERQASRLNITISFSRYVYGDPYAAGVLHLARSSFRETDFIEFGVFVEIEPGTFLDVLEEGSGTLAIFSWNPLVPHPEAYLYPLLHSSADIVANGRYNSPAFDELLDEAALLDDPVAQGELYRELAQAVYDDYAMIPIWQDHLQVVVWDDIGGVLVEPNYFLHYDLLVRE